MEPVMELLKTTTNPILVEFREDPWFADLQERAISYLEVNLQDMGPESAAWSAPADIDEATKVLEAIARGETTM